MKLKTILSDLNYLWLNSIVSHLPAWWLRRFFYTLAGMRIGKRCRIGIGTVIVRPKKIVLGEGCIINEYCHLDGRGGLIIGDETSISIYTKIISASHNLESGLFEFKSGNIVIQDHVFIGANATILENTLIKKGAVIGASSVAKGTFEENKYYVGNPIRCIRQRCSKYDYSLYHDAYFR